ncbi:WD40 repeat domain-containing protein [Streptomyces sp. NPDC001507]|uniref:WD40 repeat domain-containing protein n=1 Tax=Streptomyces sp. NPDC001507 TaxID=3364579 RepID=UPI0036B7A43B
MLTPTAVGWQPGGNVVGFLPGHVRGLCTWNTEDGRGLIAAGARDGIGVWDSSGQRLVQISCATVSDLAVLAGNSGRTFLAAATVEGAGVFDPLSGQQLAWLSLARAREVRVLREGFDRWLLAVCTRREIVTWAPSEQTHRRVQLPDARLDLTRGCWVGDTAGASWRLLEQSSNKPVLFNPLTLQTLPVALRPTTVRSLTAVTGPSGCDVLAVVRKTQHVDLLDPFSGELVARRFTPGGKALPVPLPNGATLLGVWDNHTITVWDTAAERPDRTSRFLARTVSRVAGVRTPDGPLALVAASDEGILLHRTGQTRSLPDVAVPAVTKAGLKVAQTPDGRELVAACLPAHVVLLDPTTHRPLFGWGLRGPVGIMEAVPGQAEIPSVVFTQRGGAYRRSRVIQWNPSSDTVEDLGNGHDYHTSITVQLPDGRTCLVLGHDLGVDTLSLQARQRQFIPLSKYVPVTHLLALPSHPDQCLVAGLGRGKITVWDLVTGQSVQEARPLAPTAVVRAACLLPLSSGTTAVAIATSRGVRLWNPDGWNEIRRFEVPPVHDMLALAQGSGSALLAAGTASGLSLWDPRTGRLVRSLITAAPVTSIVHTTSGGHRLHIGGPAGLAALTWSAQAPLY